MEELTYRLDQYEGPLDLLLSLIAKNKVSIIDIPIASICDQYMEFIENARRIDLNIASEFIVMASELMLIKSKMLLPRESDDHEDPRKVLVDALLLYQKAKENANESINSFLFSFAAPNRCDFTHIKKHPPRGFREGFVIFYSS